MTVLTLSGLTVTRAKRTTKTKTTLTMTKLPLTAKTAPTRQVLGVLRVSTNEQDLQRQRTDLKLAERIHGLRTERVLELDGVSGTTMNSNREVQRVLDSLERTDIHGVIVSSLDRLIRPG